MAECHLVGERRGGSLLVLSVVVCLVVMMMMLLLLTIPPWQALSFALPRGFVDKRRLSSWHSDAIARWVGFGWVPVVLDGDEDGRLAAGEKRKRNKRGKTMARCSWIYKKPSSTALGQPARPLSRQRGVVVMALKTGIHSMHSATWVGAVCMSAKKKIP